MELESYEQFKFELAELIRSGQLIVSGKARNAGRRSDSEQPWVDLLTRLAEDRFTVVVAGRFNQGKSTLMNALLGLDRLPTGVVPLTSVITYVRYGTNERVLINYEGRRLRGETTLAELAEYITEKGNPGNVKQIHSAEIQLPSEILRRGFFLVDTPGLGSAIPVNAETTERFIPEIDVLILVTSYQSPLTGDEVRFLRQASASVRAVFVVINKHDTVAIEERAEVTAYVERNFSRVLASDAPKPFSVSAKDGLAAKLTGDEDALRASGIPNFESALVRFLVSRRSALFLSAICDRARAELNLLPQGEAEPLVSRLDGLQQRLKLDEVRTSHAEPDDAVFIAPSPSKSDFWRVGLCEVCREVIKREFDFLAQEQYALSSRPEAQEEHAGHDGYCALHTWHYESITSPRAICTAYPTMLHRLADRLRSLAASTAGGTRFNVALLDSHCPACALRWTTEDEMVESILRRAGRTMSWGELSPSALCLPHLQLILQRSDDESLRHGLLSREAAFAERIAEDMQRYAIKHDGIRRALVSDEEVYAPLRALQMLVGHRNVNAVPSSRES